MYKICYSSYVISCLYTIFLKSRLLNQVPRVRLVGLQAVTVRLHVWTTILAFAVNAEDMEISLEMGESVCKKVMSTLKVFFTNSSV